MKIDWESAPMWPFYAGLYVLAGFVVTQSLRVENARACEASSPLSVQQQLWLGATWPLTAGRMVLFHQDPMASIL